MTPVTHQQQHQVVLAKSSSTASSSSLSSSGGSPQQQLPPLPPNQWAGAHSGAQSAADASKVAKYKRIMLKVSGEALQGDKGFGLDPRVVEAIALEIKAARQHGIQVAVVVGGGNYFRGASAWSGLERATADYVGMLATVMNALCLQVGEMRRAPWRCRLGCLHCFAGAGMHQRSASSVSSVCVGRAVPTHLLSPAHVLCHVSHRLQSRTWGSRLGFRPPLRCARWLSPTSGDAPSGTWRTATWSSLGQVGAALCA